jgi:hypothetical protein
VIEEEALAEGKIVKSWGLGCARQTSIAILIFLVLLTGFIGLIILSITVRLTEDQRVYLWVAGFVLLLFLVMIGILFWANRQIRQRLVQLDAACMPLGLSGKGYLWNGRQYHGIYRGRQADIYFFRGPTLDIYLASQVNTRLGIGLKGQVSQIAARFFTQLELDTNDPELAKFSIFALDAAWGQALLNAPQAKDLVLRLAKTTPGLEFRNLLFQPDALHLQINRIQINEIIPENIRSWLDGLQELAEMAESLPPPQVTAVASAMERRNRLNRSGYTLPMLVITCAVVGIFAVIFVIALIVIITISQGGI